MQAGRLTRVRREGFSRSLVLVRRGEVEELKKYIEQEQREGQEYYSIQQAAQRLGLSPTVVRRLVREGHLSVASVGKNNRQSWLWKREVEGLATRQASMQEWQLVSA
jgi:excisionase family DNA binding protein